MSIQLSEAVIVIIEDDQNAQLIALELLRMHGASNCYARKSVDAALSLAKKLPRVDVFLSDVNMPGLSGYDLLSAVREDEKFKDARVVAVTAGNLSEDVNRAREAGFDGFITKPLKMAQFADQVRAILNGEKIWDLQ